MLSLVATILIAWGGALSVALLMAMLMAMARAIYWVLRG